MQEISADVFENENRKKQPLVIKFFAEWCGPCRAMGPVFEKAAKALGGRMGFFSCDIDANQEFAQANGVMSVPTIIVFREGKEAGRIVGSQPEDLLQKQLLAFS
jgi:thioredoxin 1